MNISLYQIVVPIGSFFMMFYALSQFRRGKKTIKQFIIWCFFWLIISFFAAFPNATAIFAQVTGIKDNVNAIMFLGVGVLYFLVFKLFFMLEDISRKLTKVIRYQSKKDSFSEKK